MKETKLISKKKKGEKEKKKKSLHEPQGYVFM